MEAESKKLGVSNFLKMVGDKNPDVEIDVKMKIKLKDLVNWSNKKYGTIFVLIDGVDYTLIPGKSTSVVPCQDTFSNRDDVVKITSFGQQKTPEEHKKYSKAKYTFNDALLLVKNYIVSKGVINTKMIKLLFKEKGYGYTEQAWTSMISKVLAELRKSSEIYQIYKENNVIHIQLKRD